MILGSSLKGFCFIPNRRIRLTVRSLLATEIAGLKSICKTPSRYQHRNMPSTKANSSHHVMALVDVLHCVHTLPSIIYDDRLVLARCFQLVKTALVSLQPAVIFGRWSPINCSRGSDLWCRPLCLVVLSSLRCFRLLEGIGYIKYGVLAIKTNAAWRGNTLTSPGSL